MTPTAKKRILWTAGYTTFFFASFLFMLYLTFPYRAVADRLVAEARKANIGLTIGSVGPSFGWVRAKTIALTPPKHENGPEPEAIPIDEVKVRPTLFPIGLAYEAKLFGGTVDGKVGVLGRQRILIRAKGLDLAKANSKAAMGLDLAGKLSTDIDLVLDPDGTKTTGKLGLDGESLVINGGSVGMYDLPKMDLGRLELTIKLDGGKGTVDFFKTQGSDVEANLEGEVQLAQTLLLSPLNLKLKFKPSEEFLKRNSIIQSGLSMAMSKDSRGFYTVSVARYLGNPAFQPQR
jgi:type II secretion system protein N